MLHMTDEDFYRGLPRGMRMAEVGVWKGDHAQALLDRCQPSLLLLVDVWRIGDPTNVEMLGTDPAAIEALYPEVVVRFAGDRRVVVLRMASVDAADILAPASLDLVYVDACHFHEEVLADLEAWSRVVRPGGCLCGHDWDHRSGVNKAVMEFTCGRGPDVVYEAKGRPLSYVITADGDHGR